MKLDTDVARGFAADDCVLEIQPVDIVVCKQVQRGLRSRSYTRGRFSARRENGVHHFQPLVTEFLDRP
ncbi:MAG TPA: SRPBCC family protein [Verrucomicrobiae bacterium]|nr:SRPBCC family protein [Verrucomicrobiae bacterium]